ncbi:MAG TPA: TonB-dependent receptor [Candidatus Eisenbacteria bacterium]
MVATLLSLTLLVSQAMPIGPAEAAAETAAAPADTVPSPSRIVRRFAPLEVRAPLHDLRSSQTVHTIAGPALRMLPADQLADLLVLQPGVVAQAEELHVRGGRAGETTVNLGGLDLDEPLRRRPMPVPLFALRSVDLVSGAPGAQYGCGLAGVLDLHTMDPGERPSLEWRWQSDGRLGTHYDRIAGRLGTPLRVWGLGLVAAADATLDDTWLPSLRSLSRREVAGLSFGWRAENRLLGYAKLAPVGPRQPVTAQVLVGRQVHRPYDPAWSLDGWTYLPPNIKESPEFSTVPLPGYQRYRAADHFAITDESDLAALVSLSARRVAGQATLSLGLLRTRSVTSVGGGHESPDVVHRPSYANPPRDRFYVLWGDYPLYRESAGDVLTLRGDLEATTKSGGGIKAGSGLTYETVSLREMDWPLASFGWTVGELAPSAVDSIRSYRAFAPGGFGYVQSRWLSGGLVMNTGMRVEYFTAGPQAGDQTLPGSTRGVWSLSPRLGIAYPISVRDVFSLAYSRVHQAPGRDFLYDRRGATTDRQPLGNPALQPSTAISYEAAVKHLLSPAWALQASVFLRDVFGQIGARDYAIPGGPTDLRYVNEDQGQALGFEWSVVYDAAERRHLEVHYTWMQAWGNESRSEGDPYGPVRGFRTPPLGDQALSWDRRHTLLASGTWQWQKRWSLSWSTAVASPLPWTPKPFRQPVSDLSVVNSRRLDWSENTNFGLQWSLSFLPGMALGLDVRNLFDNRAELAATVDGYPNPIINTRYDDYGAYRTETGLDGGAYWKDGVGGEPGYWVPVHDPRLFSPPRIVRASIGASW